MMLARSRYQTNVISKEDFRSEMNKVLDVLKQAVDILKQEPESLPEGQLGKSIEAAYKQLSDNFEMLIETAL